MTALAQERLTDNFGAYPSRRTIPMKAASKVYKGGMVAIDSSGNAMAAGLLAGGTVRVRGVASSTVDNSAGAAGALKVECQPGVFKFANHGADAVTAAMVGTDCYVLDDQTVAATSNTNTRAVAGVVEAVESDGVRVYIP